MYKIAYFARGIIQTHILSVWHTTNEKHSQGLQWNLCLKNVSTGVSFMVVRKVGKQHDLNPHHQSFLNPTTFRLGGVREKGGQLFLDRESIHSFHLQVCPANLGHFVPGSFKPRVLFIQPIQGQTLVWPQLMPKKKASINHQSPSVQQMSLNVDYLFSRPSLN